MADSVEQYLRSISLVVFDSNLDGLDLSQFRIKFAVKSTQAATPNTADIRVYNLSKDTAALIKKEFKNIVLQAGYNGNKGVIFSGNIKQVIIGRESQTDTFIDIIAGDGDRAYNYSIVNTTIEAGATQTDQLNASLGSMSSKGVTTGYVPIVTDSALPRGKVMYGKARKYISNYANSFDLKWSIQNGKVNVIPQNGYLPGQAVELTSKTGLIGTPQQTTQGVNLKCLLNPKLQTGGRVNIAEATVEQLKIDLQNPKASANLAPPLRSDGMYFILLVEHQGDTRAVDWYSSVVCITQPPFSNPANVVGNL